MLYKLYTVQVHTMIIWHLENLLYLIGVEYWLEARKASQFIMQYIICYARNVYQQLNIKKEQKAAKHIIRIKNKWQKEER